MSNLGRPHPLLLGGDSGYEIAKSLRFNSADTAHLERTFTGGPEKRVKWTINLWVKRASLGTSQVILSAGPDTSNYMNLYFHPSDALVLGGVVSGVQVTQQTEPVFRDPSAHMNIHVVWDSNNPSEEDRARIFVNGRRITSWAVQNTIPLGTLSLWGAGTVHRIGRNIADLVAYLDGYTSEVHYVDGLALDPDDFGYFDPVTDQWRPKRYTGSYGDQGFYLDFSDPNDIGKDRSTREVPFDPSITYTRTGPKTYFDKDGILQTAADNEWPLEYDPVTLEPLGRSVWEARTNSIRNSTMQGAAAPSTPPTNWGITNNTGLTREIIGVGTEDGIEYVDVRLSGVTSGVEYTIFYESTMQVAALQGQTWTQSNNLRLVGGTLTNVAQIRNRISERDAGGGNVHSNYSSALPVSTAALREQRYSSMAVLSNASTAFVLPSLAISFGSGVAIDLTLRIGLPQLEQGATASPAIPTSGSAVTRAADVVSITGDDFSSWFNPDEGTFVVESGDASGASAASTATRFLTVGDGTNDNRLLCYGSSIASWTGGGLTGQTTIIGTHAGAGIRAWAYRHNDAAFAINGQVASTMSFAVVPGANSVVIGSNNPHSNATTLNGHIRRIRYTHTRLSGEQLQLASSGQVVPGVTWELDLDFTRPVVVPQNNHWTPVNLDADDVMADTPTNNFCTLNPLNKSSSITLSDGNLRFSAGSGAFNTRATFQVRSGKWYWEYTATSAPGVNFGVVRPNVSLGINAAISAGAGNVYAYNGSNGNKYDGTGATGIAYGPPWSVGDTIGAAFDADEGTIEFFKNGVSLGVAFSGIAGGDWDVFFGPNNGHGIVNFGQRPFAYDPPAGFKALCTKNLPEPLIENPRQYFDVVTFPSGANGVDVVVPFAPDLVWTKVRNTAFSHRLTDRVRGSGKSLSSNTTNAETSDGLLTLADDGFHLATTAAGNQYVAWNWREGTLPGFDIVNYQHGGTGPEYVYHSLGVRPSLIITKVREAAGNNWLVWHKDLTKDYLVLQTDAVEGTLSTPWNPDAEKFRYTYSTPGNNLICYLWAEVPGFSAFGVYTGNGSADGPCVQCGFRPAFVLTKRIDAAGGWYIVDTVRDPFNAVARILQPHLSAAEVVGSGHIDFLSNGFKLRAVGSDFNLAGGRYIYAAFAEFPFKYANAR